ncbi:MAG TPA: lysylphosphatidylglycerol synthase transmembrane domain-containing protein, partial [Gemmatimonadaceae bacterium]
MSAEQKYDSTARGWQRLLVRVGGSAIILAALLVVLPRDELWASLRALPAYAVPVGVAAYLTAHLLGVAKWRLLVNTAGAELSVRPAARAYYWGLFGNLFLPSVVGGDVVRAGMALRAARSRTGLLFGSLVDRVQDVIGLGVLAGVGALVSPRSLDEASARIFTMFVLLVAALGIVGLSALFLFPVRRLSFAIRR